MSRAVSRKIGDFLPGVGLPEDLSVNGLQLDSRLVQPGELFFAVPGSERDGRKFIDDAIRRGAVAVVCELPAGGRHYACEIPIAYVSELALQLGFIACRYYNNPSNDMELIAVTGTNGKTSCCHFISQALSRLGFRCGVIGTIGYGIDAQISDFGLTTPDPISFQKYLAEMRSQGAMAVALEASSHGLAQGRLNGASIETAVFTNLTRDHLDYHQTLDDYKNSKKSLFVEKDAKTAVLNFDDLFGRQLATELAGQLDILTYSIELNQASVYCSEVKHSKAGISACIHTPWGDGLLVTDLYGEFNLSNLLAVVCVLGHKGYNLDRILEVVQGLKNVRGRMDRITLDKGVDVVIDYAHTPDALENVLRTLRSHCDGELWCVFGCGGNRDKGKRSEMGRIAVGASDHVVLTDDNPRTESREAIIKDILSGISERSRVMVEPDRSKAIRFAITKTQPGDVLLIAGKGHEEYQDINGKKIKYSDYEEVSRANERSHQARRNL